MSGGIVWDADEVSRAVNMAAKIERINKVIQMASFCSLAVAHGLTAASEAFAATDNDEATNFFALREYQYQSNRGA
ncbi:MAG: hypothetical protein E6212_08430 [Actinomyces sp.]|nr:hypothetical protein [Actinomyces sp.]